MKANLIKVSMFTFFVLFISASNAWAVDKHENAMATSKPLAEESVDHSNSEPGKVVVKKLNLREKFKMIHQVKKEMRKAKKSGSNVPMVVLYILAVLLPPLAVGLFTNWGEPTLWNLLFTILFWLPGIIHAFYILLR